ncbi:MAG: hypothetical protein JXR68_04755 [Bacteroidales bacterium]|nr:hypothetical protein [Bacteroidales bacterium]
MKTLQLFITMLFVSILSFAQGNPQISITKLTDDEGKLYVDYSILYTTPEQSFDITLDVKLNNGTPIQVSSTSGDVGTNIKGGTNKQIIWAYEQDKIYLDENISVQIISDLKVDANYYSTSKLILASTILPGRGVTMLNRSYSFIGWTIAGYGLVGASVGTYLWSKATYLNYTNATLETEKKLFYSKYQTQTIISGVSALSAIGIWGINYFRIFSTKNKMKLLTQTSLNWQIVPNFEYLSNTNMLTITYKF